MCLIFYLTSHSILSKRIEQELNYQLISFFNLGHFGSWYCWITKCSCIFYPGTFRLYFFLSLKKSFSGNNYTIKSYNRPFQIGTKNGSECNSDLFYIQKKNGRPAVCIINSSKEYTAWIHFSFHFFKKSVRPKTRSYHPCFINALKIANTFTVGNRLKASSTDS